MAISREQIVAELKKIVREDQVVTDEQVLKESSRDRYRKYEQCMEVYTQPIPAAVVFAESTDDIAALLKFADENGVNCVARTGQSAIEGGLETAKEN